MKTVLSLLFLTLAAPLSAQIFADLTFTHGGRDLGVVRIRLEHEKAPRTVANFIGLATGQKAWIDPRTGEVKENTPYYDGIICHRLIHNFVLQGGDPLGSGQGGPGYQFSDEFDQTLRHSGRYILSMANSGRNTNGSQFFITLEQASNLDDVHSVFGEVVNDATAAPQSRAIVDGFTSNTMFPTAAADRPVEAIVIESVTVSGPDLATFDLNQELPVVTKADYTFDETNLRLNLNNPQPAGSIFKVHLSSDLITWRESPRYLDSTQPPTSSFPIPRDSSHQFWRPSFGAAVVSQPAEADFPSDLAGRTFDVRSTSANLMLKLPKGNDPGSVTLPPAAGSDEPDVRVIDSVSITTDGYGSVMLVRGQGLFPIRFIFRPTLPMNDTFSGPLGGTIFGNFVQTPLRGTFSLLPEAAP